MSKRAVIIGGGLAGVEAAMQLAKKGISVELYEMKPKKYSPAHKSPLLSELVCSNSLKAERIEVAGGLLKAEMELFDSITVKCAKLSRVPAGGALAVDRDKFSKLVTDILSNEPNIKIIREEIVEIPKNENVIVAAGPLASENLSKSISDFCEGMLSFFDAAAPIVAAQSIDMNNAFFQSRYDRGGDADYINCPMNKEEYELFYNELINAQSAQLHEFDKRRVYEGCMPIEVMARRGAETMRFGPLKPVGLRDPRTGHRPWAVLQLRRENLEGSLYNLVGFQTNLKFKEQKRVFSLIPALRNVEFIRYGVMHRNTFINSPKLLNSDFSTKSRDSLFFAGQITGVEGYMESAASGILAGFNVARRINKEKTLTPPKTTIMGALAQYVAEIQTKDFQPMGASFGLLTPLSEQIKDKKERYNKLAKRSLSDLNSFIMNA